MSVVCFSPNSGSWTYTPSDGNIYKHIPHAFKHIYSYFCTATFLAQKIVAMSYRVTRVFSFSSILLQYFSSSIFIDIHIVTLIPLLVIPELEFGHWPSNMCV